MVIVKCKNQRCAWYRRRVTSTSFVERCIKSIVHISAGGIKGICLDFKPKNRAIETLERLKEKKA